MMGKKVFHEQVKKNFADVSLYMLAKGCIKPHYVPLSDFPLMGTGWADVLQLTGISACSHSLFILRNSSFKFFLVVREQ